MTHKTRLALSEWKQRVQEETCADITEGCNEDGEHHRSLKQKVLCRHVPSPCDSDEENDEMATFTSPLEKVNASRMAAATAEQDATHSDATKPSGSREKAFESSEQVDERESSTFSPPRNKANGPAKAEEDSPESIEEVDTSL